MKKLPITDIFDFLEKLEKIKAGEIKIDGLETVIRNLLAEKKQVWSKPIYLIPNNPEWVLMLFPSPMSNLFEFINTPRPFIISYISVEHINRLFLYTKEIFILLEE